MRAPDGSARGPSEAQPAPPADPERPDGGAAAPLTTAPARFHLAFPVDDLPAAEAFYAGLLGCGIGRRSPAWIDFDLGGNQITAHLVEGTGAGPGTNQVDGDLVPVRHFGLVLPWSAWEALAARLGAARQEFLIEPRVRFQGQVGEQGTFFVRDPAGNALEFKAFRDPARLFAAEA